MRNTLFQESNYHSNIIPRIKDQLPYALGFFLGSVVAAKLPVGIRSTASGTLILTPYLLSRELVTLQSADKFAMGIICGHMSEATHQLEFHR